MKRQNLTFLGPWGRVKVRILGFSYGSGPLIPIDPIDPIGYILYILYYGSSLTWPGGLFFVESITAFNPRCWIATLGICLAAHLGGA